MKNAFALFIFSLFLLSVFCSSCKNNEETSEIKSLNITEIKDSLYRFILDKKPEDYTLVQLETKKECMLGAMLNLIVDDKNIYILDKHTRKMVYFFDENGKFNCKIGKIGKGSDEYINVYDFDIRNNNLILLVERGTSRLFYFDKTSGIFEREQSLPIGISSYSMKSLSDSSWLFYNGGINVIATHKYNIISSDLSGRHIRGYVEKGNDIPPITEISINKNSFDGSYYYWNAFECKVYEIKEQKGIQIFQLSDSEKQNEGMKKNKEISDCLREGKEFFTLSQFASNGKMTYMLISKRVNQRLTFYHLFYNNLTKKYIGYIDNSFEAPSIQAPFFSENFFYCLASVEFLRKINKIDSADLVQNPVLLKMVINED